MKNLSLAFLCVIAGFEVFAQDSIPNPGFEHWTSYGTYTNPNGWNTLNFFTAATDSITCVQDSATAHSGKYSVKLISKYIPIAGQVVPGVLTNGVIDINSASVSGGAVFHSRPVAITGWYQYQQASGADTGAARVQMINGNNNVGFGYFLFNQAVNTWTPFTINISYSSSEVPDTFQIVFLTSIANNSLQQTSLLLDDLNFVFRTDQCGATKTLTQTGGLCNGDTLQVWGAAGASQIVWSYNNTVSSVTHDVPASFGATVAGSATGAAGTADSLLNGPTFTFVDGAGNLYASDYTNNRVQKFAPGSTTGVTVAGDSAGNSGTAANLLNRPQGIFVDTGGNLYISDCYNHRIQKWAPGADSGITIAGITGTPGIADSLLNFPNGIWMDASQNLYVGDVNNNRVQKFVPGATHGITVAGSAGGTWGSSDSLLNGPWAVYVDAADNLYVADRFNNRIQKWAPGANYGITVAGDSAGGSGLDPALLNNPQGIYVDMAGNMFIADAANNRVQKWAPGDTAGVTVAGDSAGAPGISDSLFSLPVSVLLDNAGNMYISDYSNNRVQKWSSSINTNLVITAPGNYTAVVTSALGCVDTTNVSLADTLPHPVVAVNQLTLSTGNYYSYQWLLNGNPVAGANSSTYNVTGIGAYQVLVSNANGCTDTSATVDITTLGINEISPPEISIYPNPTEAEVHLECNNLGASTTVELADAVGRIVYMQSTNASNLSTQIDLSAYANGVYLLTIKSANMVTVTRQVVKN